MMLYHRLRNTISIHARFLSKIPSSSVQNEFKDQPQSVININNKSIKEGDSLVKRLLSLIYPQQSAVVVLNQWKEEGKTLQKYQLNRVVRDLRKHNRHKHALEICEWMRTQPDIKLLPGDYAVHLDLVAKIRGLASAEQFFLDIPERMKGQSTCTALLHTYVQNKMSDKAEALMKQMSIHGLLRCTLPYNHMLNLYVSTGKYDKMEEMVKELKRNTDPDVFTYNLWLKACADTNDVKNAEDIFREMKERKLEPEWVTFSTLSSIYIKTNNLKKAKETIVEMEKRISGKERAGYCSLISLHANISDRENILRLWDKMKLMFGKLSDVEYKCMLSSLTKLGDVKEAESIYKEWETVSDTHDSGVLVTMLAFYIKNRMIDKAESFHASAIEAKIKPSYSTWELMAWGYLRESKMDEVLESLKKAFACLGKRRPNIRIVRALFDKLEKDGNVEDGEKFLDMLRDVGLVSTEIYNCLLCVYLNAQQCPRIVEERMKTDNVALDEETHILLEKTKKYV